MKKALLYLLILLAPTSARALDLKICNVGDTLIYLSTAIANQSPLGQSFSVAGWSQLSKSDCWTNPDKSTLQIDVLAVYVDSSGKPGATPYDLEFQGVDKGPFTYRSGNNKFCIDLDNRFHRPRVTKSDVYCEEGMVLAPYLIRVIGSQASGTLNLSADPSELHTDATSFTAPRKPADRGDSDRLSLALGPSEEQIAGAETRDLLKRLKIASVFLGLRDTDIDVGRVDIERCVVSKTDTAFCRYAVKIAMTNNELGPIADLMNLGFLISGYQWASFVVRSGRWEIARKYEDCRISDTNINCTYRD